MFQLRMSNAPLYFILRRFMSSSNGVPMQQKNSFNNKEKLPPLPQIEIASRNHYVAAHGSARKVKYGDTEFIECGEGYILTYINSHMTIKEPQSAYYGVYWGRNHPLNTSGPVNGRQSLAHAKEVAVLRLIENFPVIEAKKLCICNNSSVVTKTMIKMDTYTDNGYRNVKGIPLHNVDTYRALNMALRQRNDLQIRLLYTPSDVIYFMIEAEKLARAAALKHK